MPVLLGAGMGSSSVYEAQVPQLPELQLEQDEPPVPATRVGTPELVVLKQAKVDILRRAGLWQRGHSAGLADWLRGRSCSNFASHSEQTYSYIGIDLSPVNSLTRLSFGVKPDRPAALQGEPQEIDSGHLDPEYHVGHQYPLDEAEPAAFIREER
jgi:hypothetical protein